MLISHCLSSLAIESSGPPPLVLDLVILHSLIIHIPECSPTLFLSLVAFLHEVVPV